MLNIVSLSVMRNKVTGPGKVVKNLVKGLDLIGYPYVINHDLNSTYRLRIHDDIFAIKKLSQVNKETKVIVGPNLYNMPRELPLGVDLKKYIYLFPSKWIKNMWQFFGYKGAVDVWPAGIDTYQFVPSNQPKEHILIYFKDRYQKELTYVKQTLKSKNLKYKTIIFGQYNEPIFKKMLQNTTYVIWIGRQETQGIALQEILSSNIPILVWDVSKVGDWDPPGIDPKSVLLNQELEYSSDVTSAEYFNDSCGRKIKTKNELIPAIDYMEKKYLSLNPRNFILTNLSLEKQARDFVNLYESHYGLSYESGLNEVLLNNKRFRNNRLVTFIFDIYDSKFSKSIIGVYSHINKLLHNLVKGS